MAIERTFSIIKPDAVAKNVIGEIYSRFEKNDLKIKYGCSTNDIFVIFFNDSVFFAFLSLYQTAKSFLYDLPTSFNFANYWVNRAVYF